MKLLEYLWKRSYRVVYGVVYGVVYVLYTVLYTVLLEEFKVAHYISVGWPSFWKMTAIFNLIYIWAFLKMMWIYIFLYSYISSTEEIGVLQSVRRVSLRYFMRDKWINETRIHCQREGIFASLLMAWRLGPGRVLYKYLHNYFDVNRVFKQRSFGNVTQFWSQFGNMTIDNPERCYMITFLQLRKMWLKTTGI